MENRDELINKMMHALDDDALEAVAGGASTRGLLQKAEWSSACESYECAMCGCDLMFANHKDGCPVKNFPYSGGFAEMLGQCNCCWSCKHIVHGNNYPADRNDLYCGRQKAV